MSMVKRDNILDKEIEKYGLWQLVKASQDCHELAHSLNKYYLLVACMKKTDDKANIVEEIADVEIMIEQVKRLLSINNRDIELIKEDKIKRLGERL